MRGGSFNDKWISVRQVIRERPLQMAGSIFCLLIAAMLDGIGLLALFPAIGMFLKGENQSDDPHWIVRGFNDFLTQMGFTPSLQTFLVLILIIMILKTLVSLAAQIQVSYAHAQSIETMRRRLLTGLLVARWQFFTSQKTGHITNAMSSETQAAGQLYTQVADIISTLMQSLVYIGSAILIAWQITIGAAITGIVMMLLLSSLITSAQRNSRRLTALLADFNSQLVDSLGAIKSLKAMGVVQRLEPRLQTDIATLRRVTFKLLLVKRYMTSAQDVIRTATLILTIYLFATFQPSSVEALLTVAFVFLRSLEAFNRFQRGWQSVAVAEVPYRRACDLLDAAQRNVEHNDGAVTDIALTKGISLASVTFSYDPSEAAKPGMPAAGLLPAPLHPPVLNNFTLNCPAGKFLCILGGSGAGKTTFVDLVIGLITPQSGQILIDNMPLASVDMQAWRRIIGYVPQEVFLFNAPLRDNITLGDKTLTDEDIDYALRASGAKDFVDRLAQGVDSPAGERGSLLSGGQRQRICIARALVRRPKLLILDEATSALDSKTEQEIATTVRSLTPEMTILAITHRPALADLADHVVHMSDGAVKGIVNRAA